MKIDGTGQVIIKGSDGSISRCSTLDDVNTVIRSLTEANISIRTIGMQVDNDELACTTRLDFGKARSMMTVTATPKVTAENDLLTIPDLHGVASDTDGTLVVNEKWFDIFSLVKDMDTRTAAWLAGVRRTQVEEGRLILDFRSEKHVIEVSSPRHTDVIVGAIRVITGLNLEIVARYAKEDAA